MGNKNKKSESKKLQAKINGLLKKYKIRECKIKLDRLSIDNDLFRKALFDYHRIRDCFVRLDHNLPNPKKKLHLTPAGSIRSKAICFPTTSSVLEKSSGMLSSLGTYREKHAVVPFGKRKNVTTLRTKSIFAVRKNADEKSDDDNGKQYSLEDLNSEFRCKYNSPNRGLKSTERIAQKPPQPLSQWQIIQNDFQNRIQAKYNSK